MGEVEKERDLKLVAEEKLTALETRAIRDAMAVDWLHKEWDGLSQIVERLRSERNMARNECS